MNRSEPSAAGAVEPPLWSIGLAAIVILLAPMVLYSIAPAGPIREGDTIFSNGAHKVALFQPDRYHQLGFESTCMLDPKDPLIVLQTPNQGPDGVMVVRVQGKSIVEWPFCPPQAELLLRPSQATQKPNVFQDVADNVRRMFKR
jgi:hypothetical protein